MFETLKQDVAAVLARDPAIHSKAEVFFCYPGFRAVRRHRRAHRAYQKGHFFWARLISARTKRLTGIDIHPGAVIGQGLFIDHGSGVVIGETAVPPWATTWWWARGPKCWAPSRWATM